MHNNRAVKRIGNYSVSKRFIVRSIYVTTGILILLSFLFQSCSNNDNVTDSTPDEPIGKLYVLNQIDNTLYIYDSQTLSRIDSIDTRVRLPHYIEFAPDGQNYYIVTLDNSGGYIAKFDALTDQFVDSVSVPAAVFPSAIAITADSRYGYVSNFLDQGSRLKIHKFDLFTMQLTDSIPGGAMTHDLKITSDGSTIVACNMRTDDVTIVNTATDTVIVVPMDTNNIAPSSPFYGPYGVIIDHKDSLAYIACIRNQQVRVLDIAAAKIVDSVDIPVHASGLLAGPTLMAVSPDDQVVFVTTQDGNSVVVFRASDGAILADIPLSVPFPFGVTISDDGTRVYVACLGTTNTNGWVYVIDGNNYTKVDSIKVGKLSYGLIWHSGAP